MHVPSSPNSSHPPQEEGLGFLSLSSNNECLTFTNDCLQMKICLELHLHSSIKKGLSTERKLPLGGSEERVKYSKGQHYHWKRVTLDFLEHSAKKDVGGGWMQTMRVVWVSERVVISRSLQAG